MAQVINTNSPSLIPQTKITKNKSALSTPTNTLPSALLIKTPK
ncbi:flagellin FliC, partial [Escherichia coli]